MIRFLICNVFISGIIGILLITKQIFKNNLSSRMQYNLWFLLLGLLAVPFIPFRLIGFPQIFSWLGSLRCSPASGTATAMGEAVGINPTGNTDWMNDFSLSVNSETPSIAGYILLGIWIVGIFAMIILVIKSSLRLRTLEKSALPLQNPEVRSRPPGLFRFATKIRMFFAISKRSVFYFEITRMGSHVSCIGRFLDFVHVFRDIFCILSS